MTDIVERLRNGRATMGKQRLAADEITRLRAEVEER